MRRFVIWIDGHPVCGIYAIATQVAGRLFNQSDLACEYPIGKHFKIVEVR